MTGNREENRSEVLKVTQLDYTFERQLMLEREEALSEGIAKGREEGITEGIARGIAKGKAEGITEGITQGFSRGIDKIILTMHHKGYTIQQISDVTEKSVKEIEKLIEMDS